ncbi:MAG: DMT family transporter [Polyangiaceae bacterium]|nr:DMT family transporter [Polyangiaceae bacterium]
MCTLFETRDRMEACDYRSTGVPIGELFALTAAATWAVGSLIFAKIGERASPGAMNLGKCLAAAIVLTTLRALFSGSIGGVAWSNEAGLLLGVSGIVGLTIGDTAYFGAIVSLGVPRAILLLSSAPVFAAVGGRVFLNEQIGPRETFGILLTLGGIVLVVTGRKVAPKADETSQNKSTLQRGVAFGMVAAVCQAVGSLLARRGMKGGIDPLAASAIRLIAGVMGLVIVAAVIGQLRPWARDLKTHNNWLKVSGASLIGTVGGIWLSQLALAHCSSTGVATTLLAKSPIFALPLAHFLGHEKIRVRAAAGTLAAIAGATLLSVK